MRGLSKINIAIFSLILLFNFSCSDHEHKSSKIPTETNVEKVVVDSIPQKEIKQVSVYDSIALNSNEFFTVYKPSNYLQSNKYPVVYCLDPQGRGKLPLQLYKSLADELGVVLVGSYFSKNGRNLDEVVRHVANLQLRCNREISIDTTQEFVLGFSGGAKLAASIAESNPTIDGVIGVSGGLINGKVLKRSPVFVFVGVEDFNYESLIKNSGKAEIAKNLVLRSFLGGHEWPSTENMKIAFLYQLGKKNELGVDKQELLLAALYNTTYFPKSHYLHSNFTICEDLKIKHQFESIAEVEHRKGTSQIGQSISAEEQIYNQLKAELVKPGLLTLYSVYQNIKTQSSQSESSLFAFNRACSHLSLNVMASCMQKLSTNRAEGILPYIQAYKVLQPKSYDGPYLEMLFYISQNNNDMAYESFKEAVDMGFDIPDRLINEELLKRVMQEKRFVDLAKEIR